MTAGGSFLDKLLLGIKEVEWNGGAVTFRPTINFLGGTVADNAGNDSTDVTLGSGGGGFTPGGDLSGTSTSQSVVGIRGNAIPSLSTGVLQWTGSVWSFATTASIFTPGGDLTGTATSQEVTGLLTHALPSLVSGYLQWTGSAWALSTPGSGFTAGGDLSGSSTAQEVVGLLSHALPSLGTGALTWTGSSWAFVTAGGGFTAGGDLSGSSTSQEVTGILSHALPSISTGALSWTGSSWAFVTPVSLPTLTNHDVVIGAGTTAPAFAAPSATAGVPLVSQGSSSNPAFGVAVVAGGGTGLATLTAHAVMLGEGTGNVAFAAPSTVGQVLTSNGATSDPSFQAIPASGLVATGATNGSVIGTVSLTGSQQRIADVLTITVPAGATAVDVWYTAVFENGSTPPTSTVTVQALVDGGVVVSDGITLAGTGSFAESRWTLAYRATGLSAGSHTFSLQAAQTSGLTAVSTQNNTTIIAHAVAV